MKHIEHIGSFIHTLRQSSSIHALVIQSPPGWAKSATIEQALTDIATPSQSLGSFSTPLYLYNAICDHPDSILVLDDCAGLFEDVAAMSVLKAATWPSVGSNGERKVSWHSTSDRVRMPSTIFSGKFILLANGLPAGREMEAFLSRTLHLSLNFQPEQVAEMLVEAAGKIEFYEDPVLANRVAKHLAALAERTDHSKINLRTLQMCYEVAKANPDTWESLVNLLLPKISPIDLVRDLSRSSVSVESQVRQFQNSTGLSRRTFYNYLDRVKGNLEKESTSEATPKSATCTDASSSVSSTEESIAVGCTD